jgi:hypothetical protein
MGTTLKARYARTYKNNRRPLPYEGRPADGLGRREERYAENGGGARERERERETRQRR